MPNMTGTTQPDPGTACTISPDSIVASKLLVPLKCIAINITQITPVPFFSVVPNSEESITEQHVIALCSRSFVDQQVQFLVHAKYFGQNKARTKKDCIQSILLNSVGVRIGPLLVQRALICFGMKLIKKALKNKKATLSEWLMYFVRNQQIIYSYALTSWNKARNHVVLYD